MTRVVNMRTSHAREYSLPPRQALVAAWEQDHGNFATWTYSESKCPVERGMKHLFADDLAVRLN